MEDQNLTEESLAPISPQLRENIHNDDEQRTESSDSDDDSSESDDDELQISSQLQTLEDELSINPSNYDAHVQVNFCLSSHILFVSMFRGFRVPVVGYRETEEIYLKPTRKFTYEY